MADDDDPGESIDPFAGLPLFGDLARALSGQGPLNWDAARQFALIAASGGGAARRLPVPSTPANVDPSRAHQVRRTRRASPASTSPT